MIEDVNKRLMEIQDKYQLSSANFAQRLGIARGRLSHYVNGRNNVTLEIMLTVLSKFPDISAEWLLRGKGPMLKDSNESKFDKLPPKTQETERKIEKPENTEKRQSDESTNKVQENKETNQAQPVNHINQPNPQNNTQFAQQVNNFFTPQTNGKRIINVVLVFSDNTFRPLNLE